MVEYSGIGAIILSLQEVEWSPVCGILDKGEFLVGAGAVDSVHTCTVKCSTGGTAALSHNGGPGAGQ